MEHHHAGGERAQDLDGDELLQTGASGVPGEWAASKPERA